jgi:multiple sugar transport system permease protein/raffinose/stachyose/melibiose transport system permease protein
MRSNRFVALILIPSMAMLLVFIVIPIAASFVIAMFDYNPLRSANDFIGFQNYIRMFGERDFFNATGNTLEFVFITVAINLILTLLLAQLICGVKRRWLRNLFLVIIFIPCVVPIASSAVVWSHSIFPAKGGLLNMLLQLFSVPPLNWVGKPQNVMMSIIIISVWGDIGYNTVLFTAGIDGIPGDYYEAAEIDGAGVVKRFFTITLPLLMRTFSFVAAMTLISHFQMIAQFQILASDGGPGKAGDVLTTYIYFTGFKMKDMGYASAVSVALFVIILAFTAVQQRLNRVDWGY